MPYRLEVLGRVQLLRDGRPVESFAGHRQKLALLAYLALQPDLSASRDRLVGLFWPDRDETSARHSLSELLYEIRRETADLVEGTRASVSLVADGFRCDAREFRDAVEAGDVARAEELYAGNFLEGISLSITPDFEHWAETERAQLLRAHRRICRDRVNALRDAGEIERAITSARRWLEADPFEDEAHHSLLELLYLSGDRSGALEHFDRYLKLCAEMEVEPLEETRTLVERIRVGEGVVLREDPGALGAYGAPLAGAADRRAIVLDAPPRSWSGLWGELRRRRILEAMALYVASAFLGIRAAGALQQRLAWPAFVDGIVYAAVVFGLPVVLGLAWAAGRSSAVGERPRIRARMPPGLHWLSAIRSTDLLGLLGFSGLVLGALWWAARPVPRRPASGVRVLVMPFEVTAPSEALADSVRGVFRLLANNALRWFDPLTPVDGGQWAESAPGPDPLQAALAQPGTFDYLTTGTIRVSGDSLTLLVSILDGETFDEVLRIDEHASWARPDSAVDRVAIRIFEEIARREHLPGVLPPTASLTGTRSLKAAAAFHAGERLFARSAFREAIQRYEAAIEADPNFALAYLRVAQAADWADEAPRARRFALETQARREQLPLDLRNIADAHYAYLRGEFERSRSLYHEVFYRYSNDRDVLLGLGDVYFHLAPFRGTPLAEAEPYFRRIVATDSTFHLAYYHLAAISLRYRREDARAEVAAYVRNAPSDWRTQWVSLALTLGAGSPREQEEAWASLPDLRHQALGYAFRFALLALADYETAERLSEELVAPARPAAEREIGHHLRSILYVGQGRPSRARQEHDLQNRLSREADEPTGSRLYLALPYWVALGEVPRLEEIVSPPDLDAEIRSLAERGPTAPGPFAPLVEYALLAGDRTHVQALRAELARFDTTAIDPLAFNLVHSVSAREALLDADTARALEELSIATSRIAQGAAWSQFHALATQRIVLGRLWIARGRVEEGDRWLRGFGESEAIADAAFRPAALYLRAFAAEKRGDVSSAARHADELLRLWADVEPPLRDARDRVRELAIRIAGRP